MIFSLVFPKTRTLKTENISSSPYRHGNSGIAWEIQSMGPVGKRKISVEEILYQPEAAGDYHL